MHGACHQGETCRLVCGMGGVGATVIATDESANRQSDCRTAGGARAKLREPESKPGSLPTRRNAASDWLVLACGSNGRKASHERQLEPERTAFSIC